ncbi:RDD family protein [Nocardia cyriacigeorgica]|uniref:RDD family protein n=1 Tax=Nocardia cyriacigeorgica TaxID=135487 RepID=UPI002454FCC0|nr:RDD family protein [Nocardia cyriacigeorgica]
MAEFTTGEAVALELPIARIPTRAGAFFVDVLVQLFVGWMLMLGIVSILLPSDIDSAWLATAVLVTVVTVLVGYPVACETLSRGRTLGKLIFGLRVVRADGGPIDFRHALTRGLAGAIVDFWMLGGFGAIAMISSLCSPNARRVGDVLAGTVVVYGQQRLPIPARARAPPGGGGWGPRQDTPPPPPHPPTSGRAPRPPPPPTLVRPHRAGKLARAPRPPASPCRRPGSRIGPPDSIPPRCPTIWRWRSAST